MIPGHDLRLRSMLRALNEVIIPAIKSDQQLAMDQAQILAGNLRILLAQHDKVVQFALTELREYADLLRSLLETAEGEGSSRARGAARGALDAAAASLAIELPPQAVLTGQVAELKARADAVVAEALAAGAPASRARVRDLVFEQSRRQILRERAWVAQSGFEPDMAALPSLDVLLSRSDTNGNA